MTYVNRLASDQDTLKLRSCGLLYRMGHWLGSIQLVAWLYCRPLTCPNVLDLLPIGQLAARHRYAPLSKRRGNPRIDV